MALADTITRSIKTTKRKLKAGGLLREVEWLRPDGVRDERGRQGRHGYNVGRVY